ncbi:dehydrogenase [Rhizobium rhizosphaerae]|uniref:Dehydrogenase n=1 Tax=Xaviernesmea rhizosphaerae TaxID=1672749 RepID=A0A1Q9AK96_9HYPH|nr:zinc-binding alcohol dehydrogenase [Xaviernesmea rhizosphaerae]OLP55679.1 dehydrogenase [Xaviernesmea rhizosphaerae]
MNDGEGRPAPAQPAGAVALWIEAAGRCGLRAETLPAPSGDEVLVRMLYSGISRGTESLVFKGLVPESEHERMRGPNMGGSFAFPVKYGYAAVGVVEEGPEDLTDKAVFVLHPHQDRFVVPAASIRPLPAGLPPRRAVLAANMETALNIVWDAVLQPGDRVAVFGAGVVGTLVAHIASRIAGTQTVLVDRDESRSGLAGDLGLAFAPAEALTGEFDVLVNASAAPEALESAIAHAGFEARIVEASWYGGRMVPVPLGGAFHSRRLSLISSQVGALPAARRARWSFDRRMATALALLGDARLDRLISGETHFTDLPDDYPRILSASDTLCHAIRYS